MATTRAERWGAPAGFEAADMGGFGVARRSPADVITPHSAASCMVRVS
jgi:hypothetical protein